MMIALSGVVAGMGLGWLLRRKVDEGPRGFAVVYPTLEAASVAWRPGGRVYKLSGDGATALTLGEVQDGLAAHLGERKAHRRAVYRDASPPPPPNDPDRIPPSGGRWKGDR